MAPWQKPWKSGERRLPENLQSGKPYRGGNSVYLSVAQTAKGYGDNRWATYKQIKDMGGQVRKGEKATHVLFYKFDDEREKQQPGAPERPATSPDGAAEKERTRPEMVRCYAVFNVAQADGLQLERQGDDREKEPERKAHQTAERVIQESGIRVVHERGDLAFYNMQTDCVTLPEREQFATANGYCQTALHELGHATGHPARMNRDTLTNGVGNFGSVEYAREELRAEMSAMMTGERLGVGHDGAADGPRQPVSVGPLPQPAPLLGHPPQLRLPRRAGNQRRRRALESHAQGASDLRPRLSTSGRGPRCRRRVRRTLQPVLAPREARVSHATRSA